MTYYVTKILITTALVVLISEVARRSSLAGAILASVPTVSVMALVWLYFDTGDVTQVSTFSRDIVWLVLPSLVLFILLPVLLARGVGFYSSLALAVAATVGAYFGAIAIARFFEFRV